VGRFGRNVGGMNRPRKERKKVESGGKSGRIDRREGQKGESAGHEGVTGRIYMKESREKTEEKREGWREDQETGR
jgi:hypothetical protein